VEMKLFPRSSLLHELNCFAILFRARRILGADPGIGLMRPRSRIILGWPSVICSDGWRFNLFFDFDVRSRVGKEEDVNKSCQIGGALLRFQLSCKIQSSK
jgi:hypothetical protein